MRTLRFLPAVFATIFLSGLITGCDSKPAKTPTPKTEISTTTSAKAPAKETREESRPLTAY